MRLTNEQIAEALDIDATMVSRLRNGHRLPGADLMGRIAQVYEIPLLDLVEARLEGSATVGALLRTRWNG